MKGNPSVKGSGNPSGNPSINPSPNPSGKGYPNPWDNPSNWEQEPFTDPFGKPIGEPMPHTKHLTPSNHQPSPWQPSTTNRHLSRREREEQLLTAQTDYLAKSFFAMSVSGMGFTEKMIDDFWAEGVTGQRKFLEAADKFVRHIKAEGLIEASDAYPLETAYGGAEHAVLWLKERAKEIQAQ